MDASLRDRAEQLASEFASQAKTGRRPERADAVDDEVGFGADARFRDGSSPGSQCVVWTPTALLSRRKATKQSFGAGSQGRLRTAAMAVRRKTVRADVGDLTIATPRDRDGTFEPQLIGKHQRRVPGFDEKILALYAKGNDHTGHPGDRAGTVRSGGLAHA